MFKIMHCRFDAASVGAPAVLASPPGGKHVDGLPPVAGLQKVFPEGEAPQNSLCPFWAGSKFSWWTPTVKVQARARNKDPQATIGSPPPPEPALSPERGAATRAAPAVRATIAGQTIGGFTMSVAIWGDKAREFTKLVLRACHAF